MNTNRTHSPGATDGDGNPPARDSAAMPGVQLERLVLEAPYGPATANIHADPGDCQVTYKIATDTCGLVVTVEPEHGDGHNPIPYGADLHLVCNGTRDTTTVAAVAIAAISHSGETVTFPADLLPNAGIDRDLLAAVLRAVIRDWANRPDTHRLRRRAAVLTAAERLPLAEAILAEQHASLATLISELEAQYHTVRDLRGLAGERPEAPPTYEPATDVPAPAPMPNAMERAMRAARAVAVHARHAEPSTTAIDVIAPPVTVYTVTDLLVDVLCLLRMTGLDPGELMAASSAVLRGRGTATPRPPPIEPEGKLVVITLPHTGLQLPYNRLGCDAITAIPTPDDDVAFAVVLTLDGHPAGTITDHGTGGATAYLPDPGSPFSRQDLAGFAAGCRTQAGRTPEVEDVLNLLVEEHVIDEQLIEDQETAPPSRATPIPSPAMTARTADRTTVGLTRPTPATSTSSTRRRPTAPAPNASTSPTCSTVPPPATSRPGRSGATTPGPRCSPRPDDPRLASVRAPT